jgi:hypothetical protein
MTLNSNSILKVLKILTWAGFVGLCVKTGSLMISYWVSMFRNPIGAKNLFMGLDLSQLKSNSNTEYSILVLCIVLIIILKALIFFVLLRIFKNINLVSPFHKTIGKLILKMSLLSFAIGLLSKLTLKFANSYQSLGMNFQNLTEHIGLGDTFLFFAGILFFISVLYKRGIELQTENDLTV